MAGKKNNRSTVNLLPAFFRTEKNKKFLGNTLDQLIEPAALNRIDSFVGRKSSPNYKSTDQYVVEPTQLRQQYQLEPSLIIRSKDQVTKKVLGLEDLINQLNFYKTPYNLKDLLEQKFYSYYPQIDWDKFINFREYYWFPMGIDPVDVSGNIIEPVTTISVKDNKDGIQFDFDSRTPSAELKLYRGYTYVFDVDCARSFFITYTNNAFLADGNSYDSGVVNNGTNKGKIVFTVNWDTPDRLFYAALNEQLSVGAINIFDQDENTVINVDEIVGKKSYTSGNNIEFINGLTVRFDGTVYPESYRNKIYIVEGVGDSIRLVDRSTLQNPEQDITELIDDRFDGYNFDIYPFDSFKNLPIVPEYVTINRASKDLNPWSRYNRWYHSSVLKAVASINGKLPVLPQNYRANRPIIEFVSGLKLFKFGHYSLGNIKALDQLQTNAFYKVENSFGFMADGYSLQKGDTVIFALDNDVAVRNKIYEVDIVSVTGLQKIDLKVLHEVTEGANIVVLDGETNKGKSYFFDGTNWILSQEKTSRNQAPLFDLFDPNGISYSSALFQSDFKGTKVFSYAQGTGTDDKVLGFPLKYKNTKIESSYLFDNNYNTDVISIVEGDTVIFKQVNACYLKKYFYNELEQSYTFEFKNVYSEQQDYELKITTDGLYEFPINNENNPLNEYSNNLTYSEIFDHVETIVKASNDFKGSYPGVSNLSSLAYLFNTGTRLILNENSLAYSLAFLSDKNNNIISAIRQVSEQYNQFKHNLLKFITDRPYIGPAYVFLDQVLSFINKDKISQFGFYNSLMLGIGLPTSFKEYQVSNIQVKTYYMPMAFDPTVLSEKAVYVYLNDVQLIHGTDYIINSVDQTIELKIDIELNDKINIRCYVSIVGNYVPPTPTSLGLYPKFKPSMYFDNTYIGEPVKVIQGHDGSIIVAYNDYRDDIILEYETRVYNSIKATYDHSLFDINSVLPSLTRSNTWGADYWDIMNVIYPDFVKWKSGYNIDYENNTFYDNEDLRSFNFSELVTTRGYKFPGNWRGIFKLFFDTDRPHTNPWEMLGFGEQPEWWEQEYGPAPYTKNNNILWEDLEKGIIRQGIRKGQDNLYKRDGLINYIPVDSNGDLINLINWSPLPIQYLNFQNDTWEFGDHGPAETAWRRSSAWPYAVQILAILTKPAKYLSTLWDPSRYVRINNQLVKKDSNLFPSLNKLDIPYLIKNNTKTLTSGYSVLLVEANQTNNLNYVNNLYEDLTFVDYRLAHKVGGFISKDKLQIVIDSLDPDSQSSGILLPSEDYEIFLNSSNAVKTVSMSGVIVQKVANGYQIRGYDNKTSYFEIRQVIHTTGEKVLRVGGRLEEYEIWASRIFYSTGAVVKYENRYYRVNTNHTSGDLFDSRNYNLLTDLPEFGGAEVYLAIQFENNITRVPYGKIYSNVQEVVDFILGYDNFLSSIGVVFDDYNTDLAEIINWTFSIKEFLFWSTQNWALDSVLTLSPFANKFTLVSESGVVDNIFNSFYEYNILDESGKPLTKDSFSLERDGINFIIHTINNENAIYFVRLNLVQKEHILIFNNLSRFNDVIYDRVKGYRQTRIRLVGFKTIDWNGDYFTPGFIYDDAYIQDWQPYSDYLAGDLVRYNNKYYSLKRNIIGTKDFEQADWDLLGDKPIADLLPNFDYKINQFEDFYSLDIDNFDSGQQKLAQHLIGYSPRPYLTNILINPITQYKFYQGYIREKGTRLALENISKASSENSNTKISVSEEWALRLGNLGSYSSLIELEFLLNEKEFIDNRQLVQFKKEQDILETVRYQVTNEKITIKPNLFDIENIFKPLSVNFENNGHVLMDAGYPRPDDVDIIIKNWNELKESKIKLSAGQSIWVAFDQNNDWMIYRTVRLKNPVINVENYQSGQSFKVTTKNYHYLNQGDRVLIQYLNDDFDKVFEIISIPSLNSFVIESQADLPERVDQAVLCRLETARLVDIDSLINVNGIADIAIDQKLWIDNNEKGKWEVYQKIKNYAIDKIRPERSNLQRFGTKIISNEENKIIILTAANLKNDSINQYGKVFIIDSSNKKIISSFYLNYQNQQYFDNINYPSAGFGHSLSFDSSDDLVVVGSPYASKIPTKILNNATFLAVPGSTVSNYVNQGLVTVSSIFQSTSNQDKRLTTLISQYPQNNLEFGYSVYISSTPLNKTILVGAPGYNTASGAVFVYDLFYESFDSKRTIFDRDTTVFDGGITPFDAAIKKTYRANVNSPKQQFLPVSSAIGQRFGTKIAGNLEGSRIAVTTLGDGTNGSVYIFDKVAVPESESFENFRVIYDIPYGNDFLQSVDLLIPTSGMVKGMVMMVHGGGWSGGTKSISRYLSASASNSKTEIDLTIQPNISLIDQAKSITENVNVSQETANWSIVSLSSYSANEGITISIIVSSDKVEGEFWITCEERFIRTSLIGNTAVTEWDINEDQFRKSFTIRFPQDAQFIGDTLVDIKIRTGGPSGPIVASTQHLVLETSANTPNQALPFAIDISTLPTFSSNDPVKNIVSDEYLAIDLVQQGYIVINCNYRLVKNAFNSVYIASSTGEANNFETTDFGSQAQNVNDILTILKFIYVQGAGDQFTKNGIGYWKIINEYYKQYDLVVTGTSVGGHLAVMAACEYGRLFNVHPLAIIPIASPMGLVTTITNSISSLVSVSSNSFSKAEANKPTDVNWGLWRVYNGQNPVANWGADTNVTDLGGSFYLSTSASNVDVVICDVGWTDPNHPEFALNPDGTGGTRVEYYNWFSLKTTVGDPTTATTYTPVTSPIDLRMKHSAHVAGIIAGNTQGWARKARIFDMDVDNFPTTLVFKYIKAWHDEKRASATPYANNPTIVNCSWLMSHSPLITDIIAINFRGTSYTGPFTTSTLALYGLRVDASNRIQVPNYDTTVAADVSACLAAGIIITASAGNYGLKVTANAADPDYNNTITATGYNSGNPIYYMRGGTPGSVPGVILVGAIRANSNIVGVDGIANFSNRGDRIDIFAPGAYITSAWLDDQPYTSSFGYTGLPPAIDARSTSTTYYLAKASGTSMAAPQVAGVLALMASINPALDATTAKAALIAAAGINQISTSSGGIMDPYDLLGSPNRYLKLPANLIGSISGTSTNGIPNEVVFNVLNPYTNNGANAQVLSPVYKYASWKTSIETNRVKFYFLHSVFDNIVPLSNIQEFTDLLPTDQVVTVLDSAGLEIPGVYSHAINIPDAQQQLYTWLREIFKNNKSYNLVQILAWDSPQNLGIIKTESLYADDIDMDDVGNYLYVTAPNSVNLQGTLGKVLVYKWSENSFKFHQVLENPTQFKELKFGASVESNKDGTVIAIGAQGTSTFYSMTFDKNTTFFDNKYTKFGGLKKDSGSVYVYNRLDEFYLFAEELNDISLPGDDDYGFGLAVDTNTVYVGAPDTIHKLTDDSKYKGYKQTDNFSKGTSITSTVKNWGLLRIFDGANLDSLWGAGSSTMSKSGSLDLVNNGKGVDILIIGGYIDPSHPEFAVYPNGSGGSRVKYVNWFSYKIPGDINAGSTYSAALLSNLNDSNFDSRHSTHLASIVAGNTQGWARGADIYNISPSYAYPVINDRFIYKYILEWYKERRLNYNYRPVIILIAADSFLTVEYSGITSINFRGITTSTISTSTLATKGIHLKQSGPYENKILISRYLPDLANDLQECINAGMIAISGAGDSSLKIVKTFEDQDYYNYITASGLNNNNPIYYNRPLGHRLIQSTIIVGNISDSSAGPGIDSLSTSSNSGPRIDLFAPGTNIMGAWVGTSSNAVLDLRSSTHYITKNSGSDVAAAQVAGVVALILEQNPTLSQSGVKTIIYDIATSKGQIQYTTGSVADLYDINGAVNRYLKLPDTINSIKNKSRDGCVYVWDRIDTNNLSWKRLRYQDQYVNVDPDSIRSAKLIDIKKEEVVDYLTIFDPLKGKIPSIADQEIRYKTQFDPAVYNQGTNNLDQKQSWGKEKVGELWWDLSNLKYIYYDQGDDDFKNAYWGKLFPGCSIDIYEWVESSINPTQWNELTGSEAGLIQGIDGIAKSTTDFSIEKIYDIYSDTFKTSYYFWVSGRSLVPNRQGRKISAGEITSIIQDPLFYGLPYLQALSPNSMSLVNVRSYLKSNDIVLNVLNDSINNTNKNHTEWFLLNENSKNGIPPLLERKFIDSIVGLDKLGNPIPDINLSARQRYGIDFRPKQSMFKNRFYALRNIIDYVNSIFEQNLIRDYYDLSRLFLREEEPDVAESSYDLAVEDIIDKDRIDIKTIKSAAVSAEIENGRITKVNILEPGLGYGRLVVKEVDINGNPIKWLGPRIYIENDLNGLELESIVDHLGRIIDIVIIRPGNDYQTVNLVIRPFSVLIRSDSTSNGRWAIYSYINSSWIKIKTQSFDTTRYWDFVDYKNKDYKSYQSYDAVIDNIYQLQTLDIKPSGYVKVNNYESRYLILRKTDGIQGNFTKDYDIVFGELSTIKLKDSLWDNRLSVLGFDQVTPFDVTLFDQTPNIELTNILTAIRDNIFVGILKSNWVAMFLTAVRYAHSEQKTLDWAFKTSFISVKAEINGLTQPGSYKFSNSEWYEDYVKEIKPFHSKIRNYALSYNNLEPFNGVITDFDYPLVYSEQQKTFVPLSLNDERINNEPHRSWSKNYKLFVEEIKIRDTGSGYLNPPEVIILSNQSQPLIRPARAKAYIRRGQVYKIEVLDQGDGYTETPTIVINSFEKTGENATAYCIMNNRKVRSNLINIKFDRITTSREVPSDRVTETFTFDGTKDYQTTRWAATPDKNQIEVKLNGINLLKNKFFVREYRKLKNSYHALMTDIVIDRIPNNGETLEVSYTKNVKLYSAVERMLDLYESGSGMSGNVVSQNMKGAEYPGTTLITEPLNPNYNFDNDLFESNEWGKVAFDVDNLDVQISGGDMTTSTSGAFLTARGVDPLDIRLDGDQFLSPWRSHAPEEMVKGEAYDTVGINVYSRSITAGPAFYRRVHTVEDVSTGTYSFSKGVYPGYPIIVTFNNQQLDRKVYDIDYNSRSIELKDDPTRYTVGPYFSKAIKSMNYSDDNFIENSDIGDDAFFGPYPLPIKWNMFGKTFDQVYVGSNGYLTFGYGFTNWTPLQFGFLTSPAIYVMYCDLWLSLGSNGQPLNSGRNPGLYTDSGTIGEWQYFKIRHEGGHYNERLQSPFPSYQYQVTLYTNGVYQYIEMVYGNVWKGINFNGDRGFITGVSTARSGSLNGSGTQIGYTAIRDNSSHVFYSLADGGNWVYAGEGSFSPNRVSDFVKSGSLEIIAAVPGGSRLLSVNYGNIPPGLDEYLFLTDADYNEVKSSAVDIYVNSATNYSYQIVQAPGFNASRAAVQISNLNSAGGTIVTSMFANESLHSTLFYEQFIDYRGIDNNLANTIYASGYTLKNPPAYNYSQSSQVIVELDGRRLTPPNTTYIKITENNQVEFSLQGRFSYPIESLGYSEIELFKNSVEVPGTAFFLDTDAMTVRLPNGYLVPGDTLGITIYQYPAEFRIIGNQIYIIKKYNTAGKLRVLSWPVQDNSFAINEVFPINGSGYYRISRVVYDENFVWVSLNGKALLGGSDFYVLSDKKTIKIDEDLMKETDGLVNILAFGYSETKTIGFKLFQDIFNRNHFKRISQQDTVYLTKELRYDDTEIEVSDGLVMANPYPEQNRPGIIFIAGERIEYLEKQGNTLRRIKRGTLGTGPREFYAIGTWVMDGSVKQNIPLTDNFQRVVISTTSTTNTYVINNIRFDDSIAYHDQVQVFYRGIPLVKPLKSGNKRLVHDKNYSFDNNSDLGLSELENDFSIIKQGTSTFKIILNTSTVNIQTGYPLSLVRRYVSDTSLLSVSVAKKPESSVSTFIHDRTAGIPDINYYGGDMYIRLDDGTYLTYDSGIRIKGF